jgi:hypothetical protein
MQALKTLFLHTQGERESVEEYSRNFKSLWDTVEAFGGLPGMQKGLVKKGLLKLPGRVWNPDKVTDKEFEDAENEVAEVVKAALLISCPKPLGGPQGDMRGSKSVLS